jgi:Secretion system C-terminal sorting domain
LMASLTQIAFATTYYSTATGAQDISAVAFWKSARDGSGTSPASLAIAGDVFIIQGTGGQSGAPHTINNTLAAAFGTTTIAVTLTIESGATLQADLGITIGTVATFNMASSATYIHNSPASAFASTILKGIEVFDANSTFVINTGPTTGPADPNNGAGILGFGNLKVTGLSGNTNSSGGWTKVRGNLILDYTGSSIGVKEIRLTGATALTFTVDGDLTITNGVFNIGNGTAGPTINIGGNLTLGSGGILTYTGSSVSAINFNFTKSGVASFTRAGSIQLANVARIFTFNVSNVTTLDMGVNVLTLSVATAGVLNFAVASGGGLKLGDPAGITSSGATGNIQTSGTGSTRTFSTGANYEFNGTAAQVTGSGLPATVNNLTINNAAGVTLSATTTAAGALTLTAGNLTLNASDLTATTTSGGSQTSHVIALAAGALKIPFVGGDAKTFPVGASGGSYDPVTLTPSSGPITFGVKVKPSITNAVGTRDPSQVVEREWDLTPSGAVVGPTALTFTADNAAYDHAGTMTTFVFPSVGATGKLGHWNTALVPAQWDPDIETFYDLPTRTWSVPAYSGSYSPFIVSSASAVLSVELTHFTAKAQATNNFLSWSTATERNNASFNIQRSANGADFTTIGAVKGNGTKSTISDYVFTDNVPLNGINYYRLQQLDVDGKATLSKNVAVVNGSNKTGLLKLYPSVSDAVLTVETITEGAATMTVTDLTGRVVLTKTINATGFAATTLDISNLSNGLYLLSFESAATRSTQKFIKK